MKTLKLVCAGALLSSSFAAWAQCNKPTAPTIPAEGRISGRAERAIVADMQRYTTEMTAYLACAPEAARPAAAAEQQQVTALYTSRIGPLEAAAPAAPAAAPAATAGAAAATAGAAGAAAAPAAAGVNCIPARNLSYTVGRDQHVVWRAGGQRYLVDLRHCPPMQRNSNLGYEDGGGLGAQLCNGSTIDVEGGGSCRIQNQFVPITAQEADKYLR